VLGALILALNYNSRWQVGDAHCRVSFVYVLATRTRGAIGVNAQVIGVDVHLFNRSRFWKNSYGAGGSMDAALRLSFGYSLCSVGAVVALKFGVGLDAAYTAGDVLAAALLPVAFAENFHLPAKLFCVSQIHAK